MANNPNKEKCRIFAMAIHRGESQADAYRETYPRSRNWKPETVRVRASELMKNGNILVMLESLKEDARASHNVTVDSLLDELEENRQAALTAETPQSSAATAATMGKAKLMGLDKQVIDHTSSDGSMSPQRQTLDDFYGDESDSKPKS